MTGSESSLSTPQPYAYRRRELVEPDWTRLPGWSDVSPAGWGSAQWQRAHCVKNVRRLRAVLGDLVDDRFYADLERDQAERATMSMLVPPHMVDTMVPHGPEPGPELDRGALCRPGAPLHAAGLLGPLERLAVTSPRRARLAARARNAGSRRALLLHRQTAGGRDSYGVLSTTVVRVATLALARIVPSRISRSAGVETRTLRM